VKIRIYLDTGGLEHIALGRPEQMWSGNFIVRLPQYDGTWPDDCEDKWPFGEFELKLPSRDIAVGLAEKELRKDQATMNRIFEERISKLLSLTWEGTK
jgi:hypothetical protein